MKKLDGLGWAAGIACRSFGLRIGVRVTDARVMDQVIDRASVEMDAWFDKVPRTMF